MIWGKSAKRSNLFKNDIRKVGVKHIISSAKKKFALYFVALFRMRFKLKVRFRNKPMTMIIRFIGWVMLAFILPLFHVANLKMVQYSKVKFIFLCKNKINKENLKGTDF